MLTERERNDFRALTSEARRLQFLVETVRRARRDRRRIHYMDILRLAEPVKSMLLAVLDGIKMSSSAIEVGGLEDGPLDVSEHNDRIMIVALPAVPDSGGVPGRGGRIMIPQIEHRPKFGTSGETDRVKTYFDAGDRAFVSDHWPERTARQLLFRGGFPLRGTETLNTCIELRWLIAHCAGETPIHGAQAILEEIQGRAWFQKEYLDVIAPTAETNTNGKRGVK